MIGGCDALGLSLVAGNEQSVKDDLKWILNYSREFLKKRFTFFIIQHHKESYERYQKVKSLIEDNGDKQSNLEVLIPESLFFVRRITECFDRLSSESLALDPERPGVRPLGAEGYPLESGEMTRRLRTYEASLNRLESIYIEQKAMEEFIGMVSDIPPSMSSAEAILKSETLIVDTRNIFESRQEALVYLEKELQSLLEHLHTTYHKLVSACLDALEAYLEHNELISEYEKLVTVLDAMEDPEIGRLLSKLDSYEKLIEEFKIRSSNFESSMEIKRGMITEVRLNLDKSKREHQKKKRALENAKRVCENFDPKIPKLITW